MSDRPDSFNNDDIKVRAVRPRGKRGPQDGRWYWRAVRYRDGDEITLWTGWATRKEAKRAVSDMVVRDQVEKPTGQAAEVKTVRDLLEVWTAAQERRKDLGDHAKRHYDTAARRLIGTIGSVQLRQVDRSTMEHHRDVRLGKGEATSTVKADIKRLKQAWKWGREQRPQLVTGTLPRVRMRDAPVRNRRTPTPADVAKVLEHLSGWRWLAVVLMRHQGARIGEVAELRWEDVDLDEGLVTFTGKGKTRTIPLFREALEALRRWRVEHPEPSEWGTVLGVSPNVVRAQLGSKYLTPACRKARVKRFTPHGLRRLVVDLWYREHDPGRASAYLGHGPQTALKHYRRVGTWELRKAVRSMENTPPPEGEIVPFPEAAEGGRPAQETRTTSARTTKNPLRTGIRRGLNGTPKGNPSGGTDGD